MNPNENINRQRRLAAEILARVHHDVDSVKADELAKLVVALDLVHEPLGELVKQASELLRVVNDRVDFDTWQDANPDAAASLARALDAWDEFEQTINPEQESR